MRTITEEWEKYRKANGLTDAPPILVWEAKRAFYCGYWVSLNLACTLVTEEVSVEAHKHILAGLLTEALDFTRQVIASHPQPPHPKDS